MLCVVKMVLKLVKPLGTREHLLRTFAFVTIVINLTGIPPVIMPQNGTSAIWSNLTNFRQTTKSTKNEIVD